MENQYQLKFSPRDHRMHTENRVPYTSPNAKNSPSPGYWKNYLPNEVRRNDDTVSAKNSIRQLSPSFYSPRNGNHEEMTAIQNSRIKDMIKDRKDEQIKRKKDIMRRVKQLQDKVLPMVQPNNYHNEDKDTYDFAWQSRMQQKIHRLEMSIDTNKKQMQLSITKRIIDIENKWENKFNQLHKIVEKLL